MTDKKTSVEAMFPIGRPSRTAADKTCPRCKGTGWWDLGRKCFKCGGLGHYEKATLATQIRDKRAHVEEVRGIIAELSKRLDRPGRVFGRTGLERDLAKRQAQLVTLEAELAALEDQS